MNRFDSSTDNVLAIAHAIRWMRDSGEPERATVLEAVSRWGDLTKAQRSAVYAKARKALGLYKTPRTSLVHQLHDMSKHWRDDAAFAGNAAVAIIASGLHTSVKWSVRSRRGRQQLFLNCSKAIEHAIVKQNPDNDRARTRVALDAVGLDGRRWVDRAFDDHKTRVLRGQR